MRELASYCGPDLCHFFGRPEPVEPRHQRRVQACRDANGRRWNGCDRALSGAFTFRFQHRLRHFLNEQRNAIGTFDNVLSDAFWHSLCCQ